MTKNFALIGAAGYIAPRHINAIKETGNKLIAATDPNDSVGILDRYFHEVSYFKEFERFDRHLDKLKLTNSPEKVDYVSICSPNYLHDAHIRAGLRLGADIICEKPLVINPWNIDYLKEVEANSGNKINTVLQLRVHPAILKLKQEVENSPSIKRYDIDLSYFTSRGPWYHYSWKGDMEKSGGLVTNIGVHFFDMLTWIFGEAIFEEVHISDKNIIAGYMKLEKADVKWALSIKRDLIPPEILAKGQTTYRSITIDKKEIEFSSGFTDLHTMVYQDILAGNGYGIDDAQPAIELVHKIKTSSPTGLNQNSHHLLK